MTQERLEVEIKVLNKLLPPKAYNFMDMDTEYPYVLMAARTNRGNAYTLRINLDGFPQFIPEVYVTRMLKDYNGNNLDCVSADMHTLDSCYGYTAICHYDPDFWSLRISLSKIYLKCRLWLEMYELHLQSGKPLDYYLNHME